MIELLQALCIVLGISAIPLALFWAIRKASEPDEHAGKGDGAGIG